MPDTHHVVPSKMVGLTHASLKPMILVEKILPILNFINPMKLAMEAMQTDQLTRSQQQEVDSSTGLAINDIEAVIEKASDPSDPTSVIYAYIKILEDCVNSSPSSDNYAQKVTSAESALNAASTGLSNSQNEANSTAQQSSNRTSQDGTDLGQVVQLLASLVGILSTNSGLMSK